MPAKSVKKVLVVNGPNLDVLGIREPEVYGTATLADLEAACQKHGRERGIEVACFQSNSEAAIIDALHDARTGFDAAIINPGAFTHYSYAIRDAVAASGLPTVEVHLSDISRREPFRRVSVIAPACVAQVKGLGIDGYRKAIDILADACPEEPLGEGYECRYVLGDIVISGQGLIEGLDDAERDAEDPASAGIRSCKRQEALAAACAAEGIDALLVRDTPSIQWLTAFDGVFDDERAHALLISGSAPILHTDSRYAHAARRTAASAASNVTVSEKRVSHAVFASEALAKAECLAGGSNDAAVLGFEDTVGFAEYQSLTDSFAGTPVTLQATSNTVLGLRAVKDASELARMRCAQAITDATFEHIIGFMRAGMTERDVQIELDYFMMRRGADGLAFPTIVATGPHAADPHAQPGDAVLEEGQCVVMDFGARYRGYCSDMTRTVFVGRPDEMLAQTYGVLRRANEAVEAMLAPGITGKQAHETAEKVLAEGGFANKMGHGLGHGVGLEVHELPNLNLRNEAPLVPGNVVTVEPGIYLLGKFGMRLEDYGVITPDGFEVFTKSRHEMVII